MSDKDGIHKGETNRPIGDDSHSLNVVDIFISWITNNKKLIKDKVILEMGSGSGLLSMLAAKNGASRVIGIDCSKDVVDMANENAKRSNLSHIVTFILGDEFKLPGSITEVDVIVCNWIGQTLFQPDRLLAVLEAKEQFLKPDGIIIPDCGQLYLCAISDLQYKKENIDWWNNVCGFNLSAAIEEDLTSGICKVVTPDQIVTNRCKMNEFNLKDHTYEDITKKVNFEITAKRNDYIQGICCFLTASFSLDRLHMEISADPILQPELWLPSVFYFQKSITIKRKEKLRGVLKFKEPTCLGRQLELLIGVVFKGQLDECAFTKDYVVTFL